MKKRLSTVIGDCCECPFFGVGYKTEPIGSPATIWLLPGTPRDRHGDFAEVKSICGHQYGMRVLKLVDGRCEPDAHCPLQDASNPLPDSIAIVGPIDEARNNEIARAWHAGRRSIVKEAARVADDYETVGLADHLKAFVDTPQDAESE